MGLDEDPLPDGIGPASVRPKNQGFTKDDAIPVGAAMEPAHGSAESSKQGGMQSESPAQFNEDIRLMVETQKGDRQAYARLYKKYAPAVRRYVVARGGRVESSEDLVQEVFTRVWERRSTYRPGVAVCSYLLGFARNVCREHEARVCREGRAGPHKQEQVAECLDLGPESVARQNDHAEQIRSYLAKLTPRQRQALELVYLAQRPVVVAAEIMGCSTGCVREHLSLARQKLADLLGR